ncbi:hypothetical protein Aduo_008469 [Ancylostoma duodenale]
MRHDRKANERKTGTPLTDNSNMTLLLDQVRVKPIGEEFSAANRCTKVRLGPVLSTRRRRRQITQYWHGKR